MEWTSDWARLAESVEAGELYLVDGVAHQCAQRCDELVTRLKDIRSGARVLDKVEGFGNLPSGVALAAKFGRKASGGDYSLDQALADHIAEVEQMRDLFMKIGARYQMAEDVNQQAVTAVDGGF